MLPAARCLKHDSESSEHNYARAPWLPMGFASFMSLRVRCLFLLKERAWSRRVARGKGCPTYRKGGPSEVRLDVSLVDRGNSRPERSPEQSLEHGFRRDTDDASDACRIPITFGPPGASGDGGEGSSHALRVHTVFADEHSIGGSSLIDSRMLLFLADVSSSACIDVQVHTGITSGLRKSRMTWIVFSTLMQG